jgi:putative IMPACT (imprinted ancient) family translation regulator
MAHAEGFREFEGTLSGRPSIIRSHPALSNAQSYALAASLLNQRKTNAVEFYQNMFEIERALEVTDDDQFIQYPISLVLT